MCFVDVSDYFLLFVSMAFDSLFEIGFRLLSDYLLTGYFIAVFNEVLLAGMIVYVGFLILNFCFQMS